MGFSPWGRKKVRHDFVTKNNNVVYLISCSYSLPLRERNSGATNSKVAPLLFGAGDCPHQRGSAACPARTGIVRVEEAFEAGG